MKILNIFNNILQEELVRSSFKGRYILYHSTTIHRSVDILSSNKLWPASSQVIKTKFNPSGNDNYNHNSKDYNGVSLSRDWKLEFGGVQFILNGDLIKRDYGKLLVPFTFIQNVSYLSESEEFLIGGLTNLRKYLLGVRITTTEEWQDFRILDKEGYELFIEALGDTPLFDVNFNQLNRI